MVRTQTNAAAPTMTSPNAVDSDTLTINNIPPPLTQDLHRPAIDLTWEMPADPDRMETDHHLPRTTGRYLPPDRVVNLIVLCLIL